MIFNILLALLSIALPVYADPINRTFTGAWTIENAIPNNETFIREITATIIPPTAPSAPDVGLFVWIGMYTARGDLVQTMLATAGQKSNVTDLCKITTDGNWCVEASVFPGGASLDKGQVAGKGARHSHPGSNVTAVYSYNDAADQYDQTAYLNSHKVSTLTSGQGEGYNIEANIECLTSPHCGTIPAFHWQDITIVLDAPVSSFAESYLGIFGLNGTFSTPDGGKTWHCPLIQMPERTPALQPGKAEYIPPPAT